MYLDHFGLTEPPFRITPNTEFFFSGANRGATLNALIYAITNDEGIVKVSGEVGSGKTMLCRVLMERLPENIDIVYLANPSLSREDIVCAISYELGLDTPPEMRAGAVLRMLQEHLVALHGTGRQVVVLIDEAHAMPPETLEEIRLLSNLESNRNKLLQLVLFGQPELNEILARPNMRQLKERITHNFMLEPLIRTDIAEYLEFRMRAAGYRGPNVFTVEAIKLISGTSLGLTRRINILADKALLAAFASGGHQITPVEVKAAIRDSEFGGKPASPFKRWQVWAGIALLLACVAGVAAYFALRANQTPALTNAPVSGNPEPTPGRASIADQTANAAAPPTRGPAGQSANEAMPLVASIANPPVAAMPEAAAAGPTSSPDTPAAKPELIEKWPGVGPVTRQLAVNSPEWLAAAPDNHWFIQLLRVDSAHASRVEGIAAKASKSLQPELMHIYSIRVKGKRRVHLIYGEYPTANVAQLEIDGFPSDLKALKPYPRMVKRLR